MTTDDRIPVQRRSFRVQEMDGETLLYSKVSKRTFYLNESATVIWKLCDGQRSVGEIVELLKETYPDLAEGFEADVSATLDRLMAEGAVRWQPSTQATPQPDGMSGAAD